MPSCRVRFAWDVCRPAPSGSGPGLLACFPLARAAWAPLAAARDGTETGGARAPGTPQTPREAGPGLGPRTPWSVLRGPLEGAPPARAWGDLRELLRSRRGPSGWVLGVTSGPGASILEVAAIWSLPK